MTEYLAIDQDPVLAQEITARAKQWEVNPDNLPNLFTMTIPDPNEDPYLKAQREAAEREAREGTANAKPAVADIPAEQIMKEKRQGGKRFERLSEQVHERIRRALGGTGLRLA